MRQGGSPFGAFLQLSAAGIVLALGSTTGLAQERGASDRFDPNDERQQTIGGEERERALEQDESGLFGDDEREDEGGLFGDDEREDEGGLFGDDERDREGGIFTDESDERTASEQGAASADLEQLAQEHDDLSTFVEALKTAGMDDALTEGTSYTVFAPTNEAFEEVRDMQDDELLKPENRDQLISMLRAHIVADDVDAEIARNLEEAMTLDGEKVKIKSEEDQLMVGDATVVEPDIQLGNLRVYAIDKVLSEGERQSTAALREREG